MPSANALVNRGALLLVAIVIAAGWHGAADAQAINAQAGAPRCDDYRTGLTARQRLEGSNGERLRAAEALLAPGFRSGASRSGRALLAEYQAEMERAHPDIPSAALYLASASTIPISLGTVAAVNSTLCVAAGTATATAIATQAEAARREMSR